MKENGFTLVETLIVLAIGALLLTGIGNAIASFATALEKVKDNVENSQVDLEIKSLKSLLQSARFVDAEGNIFEQRPDGLDFTARLPDSGGYKGFYKQRLEVTKKSDGDVLSLKVEDINVNLPTIILLNDVKVKTIQFPKQSDFIVEKNETVKEHKITIITGGGKPHEVVFYPLSSNEQGGIFDPISRACR